MEFVWCSLHPIRNHSTTALLNKWVPVQCVCVFLKLAHACTTRIVRVQLLKMTIGILFVERWMRISDGFFSFSQRMIFTMQQTNCTNECATNKETWRERKKNEQLHSFAFQKIVCNETFCPLAIFFFHFFVMHFWVTIFSSCGILRYIKKLRFNLNTKWWRVFFLAFEKNTKFLLFTGKYNVKTISHAAFASFFWQTWNLI